MDEAHRTSSAEVSAATYEGKREVDAKKERKRQSERVIKIGRKCERV
jgi:hypothetical protein